MILEIINDPAISFTILFMLVFLVLPFGIVAKHYSVQKRKFNYFHLKEVLQHHKDKITDNDDLIFLQETLPKLKKYYERWWFNLWPVYAIKQNKIKKIVKKYQIVVFNFYK